MSGTFFGAKGANHIGAEDFASLMGQLYGETCILPDIDDGLTLTMTDANTATLSTGGAIMEGYYFHNEEPDAIAVASGSVGYNRIDLVVLRYTQGEVNGNTVQDMTPTYIQGDATVGTPEMPSYHEGSIAGGDTIVDYPLFKLTHEGVQTPTVERIMGVRGVLQEQITARGVYATSSTAEVTAAKEVTYDGFVLTVGATVYVNFTNANSAASATLNVNGTGAYPIYNNGSNSAANLNWIAGETVPFVFDGSAWRMVNSYSLSLIESQYIHEAIIIPASASDFKNYVTQLVSTIYHDSTIGQGTFVLPSTWQDHEYFTCIGRKFGGIVSVLVFSRTTVGIGYYEYNVEISVRQASLTVL